MRNRNEMQYYEDFSCFKNFIFLSDSEDDTGEGKKLTSLVRETYVKRIRQLLNNNYKVWCENYQNASLSGEGKRLTAAEIDKCIKFLEQKALRECMVATIYQKVMCFMMSEIKKQTKEMKLYESLIKTEEWDTSSTVEKHVQTDCLIQCHQEMQTDPLTAGQKYSSLLDLPLPGCDSLMGKLSRSKNMKNCNGLKVPSKTKAYQFNETVAKVSPRLRNPMNSENVLSRVKKRRISGVDPKNPPKNVSNALLCQSMEINSSSNNMNFNNLVGNISITESNNSVHVNGNNTELTGFSQVSSNSVDSVLSLQTLLQNISAITNGTNGGAVVNNPSHVPSEANKRTREEEENLQSLDDRLMEMGLLNVEEPNGPQNYEPNGPQNYEVSTSSLPQAVGSKSHRSNWCIEMVAYSCNYSRLFAALNDEQKTACKEKIRKLFGFRGINDLMELNEDNLTICRKRIANMVVTELTPYFEKKLIASRYLFKEFAKRVTNSIMELTYAPDLAAVKQFITDYFKENKSVRNIVDIEF